MAAWRRTTMVAVLSVLMLVGTALVPGPAVAAPPAVPALKWQDGCFFGGIQCATAKVPMDYDHPHGAQVTLQLARLRATDQKRRIGTLFVNPGGPGNSGMDFVVLAAREVLAPEVLARFDIVSFDPRGVARSQPAICYRGDDTGLDPHKDLPLFPVSNGEEMRTIIANSVYAGACARQNPKLLDHMSTANVARDLDRLRQAVGDRKLTYAGFSYGTYLGATYANLFPSKVRAIWVDGVLDPVAWAGKGKTATTVPFSTRLGSGASASATMKAFLKACDAAGPRCAFSAGNPQKRFDTLIKRLRTDPIRDGGGEVLPYANLVGAMLDPLYFQDAWPFLGQQLKDYWDLAYSRPNPERRAQLIQRIRAVEPQTGNGTDGFNAVACVDTVNPKDPMAWTRAADTADKTAAPFGRLWTWESGRCATWGARDTDRYRGPFTARTAAPVLIVGNKWDPSTPYAGAVALNKLLPRSRLVTVNYAGHTSLGQSACVTKITTAYLIKGTLPAKGKVCAADRKPFANVGPEQRTTNTALERVIGR